MATIVKGKNPRKPYTVRYFHDGRQRERSFATRKEASDFKVRFEFENREQTFVDPKVAGERFETTARRWLTSHQGSPKTIVNYELALRRYILPEFGSKRLSAVASDREAVQEFVSVTLPGEQYNLGASSIRSAYMILNAIVNDAIKAGKIKESRIRGIRLPVLSQKANFIVPTREQIEKVATEMPQGFEFTIYLMRGCGLRLGEALGVDAKDFRDGTLRLARQLSPDGKGYIPLKHRNQDDYRDVPVPGYVINVRPDTFWVTPPVSHRQYREWFNKARDAAGLPSSFTPHSLRHVFASVALANGVPITDVSKWLGHRSIQVTYGIYGHLVPESWERARRVLDDEWVGVVR